MTQQPLHWQTFLGQFRYRIQHIAGVENLCGDILPRMRAVGSNVGSDGEKVLTHAPAIAVVASSAADYKLPSKEVVRKRQDA